MSSRVVSLCDRSMHAPFLSVESRARRANLTRQAIVIECIRLMVWFSEGGKLMETF